MLILGNLIYNEIIRIPQVTNRWTSRMLKQSLIRSVNTMLNLDSGSCLSTSSYQLIYSKTFLLTWHQLWKTWEGG